MYVVIMAGGGGTRLWPLSTPARPKPFIPLLGEETLFQMTVRRVLEGGELGLRPEDVAVVTARPYAGLVRAQAANVALRPDLPMLPLAMDSALLQFRRVVAQALEAERSRA